MHFIWLWKVRDIYIYFFVEKDIQLYIIYGIQEPLETLLEWEHNIYLSCSEEVEVVSWGWWAEQPQSCSSSSFRNVTSRTPRQICGSSFQKKRKENSLRLECPDANGPGLLRAGPSGEKRCTQHHTVPVSPQCPQEISLLTLPVFQGAVVSSERFSQSLPALKCSGAGRLATPSGVIRAARSAVSFRSPS